MTPMIFTRPTFAPFVRRLLGALACLVLTLPAAQIAAQTTPHADTHVAAPAEMPASAPRTTIPFKQEKQSTDTLAYQSIAALVLVGLAAYGIVFGLKRFGGTMTGRLGKLQRVRTIESIRLGRRSVLHVVEYQGKELLLAESEHGVQLLSSGPATAPPVAPSHTADQGNSNA